MTPASKIYPALTLEVMVSRKEGQYYDVKSAQKKPSELSDIVSAYANAEGGTVVIGISDKTRRVEGVNAQGEEKINNFLNLPKDCCIPMPEYRHEFVDITNDAGKPDRLILLHIKPSIDKVITTTKDEVYLRIGYKTRKLTVEEIRQLEYEKGVAHYEEEVCPYATMEDLDPELLDAYREKIGAVHQTNEQVLRARQFIVKRHDEDALTNAAVLLFGKNVRGFFPHCRIRYIKVDGTGPEFRLAAAETDSGSQEIHLGSVGGAHNAGERRPVPHLSGVSGVRLGREHYQCRMSQAMGPPWRLHPCSQIR